MLDDRLRAVLARLEREEEAAVKAGSPLVERSLAVGADAGALLYAVAAAIPACRALEVGSSLGYSTLWIGAGVRLRGGRVTSLELEPQKAARWRENVHEAGLDGVAEVIVGDASASLRALTGQFDLVLIDAWKDDYETHFGLVRPLLQPGSLVDRGQRRRPPRAARCLRRGPAERSHAVLAHRADRQRARGHLDSRLTVRWGLAIVRTRCVRSLYRGKEVVG